MKTVRALTGVTAVINSISLRPRLSPADLKAQILQSLRRQVDQEVEGMAVQIEGGKVTLTGVVHSWHERDAAQGVAWSAPGITSVVNELRIA